MSTPSSRPTLKDFRSLLPQPVKRSALCFVGFRFSHTRKAAIKAFCSGSVPSLLFLPQQLEHYAYLLRHILASLDQIFEGSYAVFSLSPFLYFFILSFYIFFTSLSILTFPFLLYPLPSCLLAFPMFLLYSSTNPLLTCLSRSYLLHPTLICVSDMSYCDMSLTSNLGNERHASAWFITSDGHVIPFHAVILDFRSLLPCVLDDLVNSRVDAGQVRTSCCNSSMPR